MAKYHNHLEYHEDTEEKHALTVDEIKFLLELQKEMNTQDHLSQADPRFWVITGTEKEYGIETGFEDGAELTDNDGDTLAVNMETAMEYIRDNLLDDINETDGIQRKIELLDGIFHPTIEISWNDNGFENGEEFENMEEITEWLRIHGYNYQVINYRYVSKIYPNTMFLTQKAAEEHLRENSHHYSEDAHTYAMTSWRNSETEILWKILQHVDWGALISYLNPAACCGGRETLMPGT